MIWWASIFNFGDFEGLKMKKTTVWNEKKLDLLKSLWEQGLPITKIGDKLGVSRNSIAGKAHRLGLPKRNSPISNLGDERKEKTMNTAKYNADLPLKVSLRDVEWSRLKCCWPLGDPKLKGFKFCGDDIIPGRPYCNKHAYVAYTNARDT